MSSSDLTSSDSAVESKPIDKEELDSLADSIDASLDAILSEAKETAAAPVNGDGPALPVLEDAAPEAPPPAEVQMALSEAGTGSDVLADDMETPLPVIVDDEPSYKAFADMVAATDEDRAKAAAELAAVGDSSEPPSELSAEPESGEILDADELIDSMTPAPEVAESILAKTEESAAYATPPPPPSDEEILDHVKLPPGSTPMPMPLVASLAAEPATEAPGSALEDDQTVISPMPPMPEPSVSLPPPRRMTSAWATPPEPSILLAGPALTMPSEGLGSKLGKMVKSPVQFSVASLVGVVLIASALGGGVMRVISGSAKQAVVVTSPAKAEAPAPAPAIVPVAAQPEKVAEKTPEKAVEKPAPVAAVAPKADKPASKPATKPAGKAAAPQPTHIALAAPSQKPAPAKKPAAPAAKPKKAANSAGWVDPFGQ